MNHLHNKQLIQVSDWNKTTSSCEVCQLSKICRLPFTLRNESSILLFDKIIVINGALLRCPLIRILKLMLVLSMIIHDTLGDFL